MEAGAVGPIDRVRAQWQTERPDLDTSPVAIFDRIDRLSKIVQAQARQVLDGLGINPWEYEVLAALRRAGPDHELAPRQLSEALLLSSGALTNRLDHLQRARLIQRRPDPADRRSLRVKLTKKGAARTDALVEASLRRKRDLFAVLSADERRTLETLLRKLLIELEPLTKP